MEIKEYSYTSVTDAMLQHVVGATKALIAADSVKEAGWKGSEKFSEK